MISPSVLHRLLASDLVYPPLPLSAFITPRLADIINRFNPEKKPALVFCTTRKGTITAGICWFVLYVIIVMLFYVCGL